ncbi:hypothetical protein CANARDRAFT_28751 [[Candida] arabinofermentans NRRL YB-2248]|uniref:Mitochondrial import receptor subunit TOM22 n=1 Tax=[Candida] arabinofermentans NRRL YB-2248 TaxID=983967 RepID=A0A1E4SZX8_9ASCO|nr:hypothetical protein CANARDRAFT_28751 [[Candida] arabinofermentans NRRL YB-2248]
MVTLTVDEETPVIVTPVTESEKVVVAAVEEDEEEDEEEEEESDDEDDFNENETILERIEALKDILSPEQRDFVLSSVSKTKSTVTSLLTSAGSKLWIVSSSILLLGVPLALSILGETQLMEMEKEMQLQQSSNELLAPGSEAAFQQPPAAA